MPELLGAGEIVPLDPRFDDTPVLDAVDGQTGRLKHSIRRRVGTHWALLRASERVPCGNLVYLGDEVEQRLAGIGERGVLALQKSDQVIQRPDAWFTPSDAVPCEVFVRNLAQRGPVTLFPRQTHYSKCYLIYSKQ